MAYRLQIRRDMAANWTAANPILAQGEVGLELDTLKEKIGNGVDAWADLPYRGATVGGNTVGLDELAPQLKNHFAMANEVIDWNAGISGTRTFTGTPTVIFTELNAPTGDVSKTISVDMTGAVNSIAFPANYRKATNASEDYDGTKINKYVFEYVNGYVYYANTLFNV